MPFELFHSTLGPLVCQGLILIPVANLGQRIPAAACSDDTLLFRVKHKLQQNVQI